MTARTKKASAALGALVVAPMLLGATNLNISFADRVIAAHNRERAALGIKPLVWDARLAVSARGWADNLAQTGSFKHAPENEDDPEGENLWAGTQGHYSVESMVDGWIEEKRYFRLGVFPNNSSTGRYEDVGHYTQLVWRRTHSVGCALARGRREDVLVCRYSEAGNYIGEKPY